MTLPLRLLIGLVAIAVRHGPQGPAGPGRAAALRPQAVLVRYAARLAGVRRPKTLAFQYTVEQLGLQNLEQSHRVYRSGARERDETVVVDGQPLTFPAIRIFRSRIDRYDVAAVAPRPGAYAFAFSGVVTRGGASAYVFRTAPRAGGAFAVSEVEIDGRTFLPSTIRFKLGGNGARGSGELAFGRADAFWLVRQAVVSAKLTSGASAHERITWSNYQFPLSLPPSTFEPPRAQAEPLPAPVATPTPAAAPLSPN